MARRTLTEKLKSARVLISNSKDETIAPLLEAIGIDIAYIERGESLYTETMQLVEIQKKEYQEQSLAYDKFYLEKDDMEASYNRTLKIVKIQSRTDTDLQNRLNLQSGKINSIESWIESASDLYSSLLIEKEFIIKLSKFKVTEEQLSAEKASIENLKQLRDAAVAEKGQAQDATKIRNEKLDELDTFTIELKGMAEVALEERPQLMEKLGITVR